MRYVVALLLLGSAAWSQQVRLSAPPARVALDADSVVVPLTKIGPFYYMDVVANGQRFRFTLETGASFFAVSTRAAQALGAQADSAVFMDSLSIGGARFYGMTARVTPLFDNMEFDGIVSVPVLHDLMWTLDLANSRLVLRRGSLPQIDSREVFAIAGRDRGGRIDVPMKIGGQDLAAVLDTRYADWIITPDSIAGRVQLGTPLRSIGMARGPSLGTFEMKGARLAGNVAIGSYVLPRAPIVFRNRPGTIVGNAFLEQFTITVDQRNGRIRFQRPSTSARDIVVADLPWERGESRTSGDQPVRRAQGAAPLRPGDRTFGFRIAAWPDGRLNVVELVAGSAAEKMGIRENDQIVELDGTPAASMNPGIFRAALVRGGPVKLVVMRDGKRLEFSVEPYSLP